MFESTRWRVVVPHWTSLLSGILYGLTSPTFGFGFLLPLCLVPLIHANLPGRGKLSNLLKEGVWFATIALSLLYFWIPPAFGELWQSPLWINWIVTIPMLLFNNLPLVAIPFLISRLASQRFFVVTFAILAGSLDYIYPKFLSDTFAHWLAPYSGFLSYFRFESSALVLNVLIMAANGLTAYLLFRRRFFTAPAVSTACILVLLFIPARPHEAFARKLEVTILNTQIPSEAYRTREGAKERYLRVIEGLSNLERRPEVRLVALPELAYPIDLIATKPEFNIANQALLKMVGDKNIALVMGGIRNVGENIANVVYFVFPDESGGVEVQWIAKEFLFPFGEVIPFQDSLPVLTRFFKPTGLVRLKNDRQYFEFQGAKIGLAICYESIFPGFLRSRIPEADFVLNPTSEAFFPGRGEPEMSFALTVFSSLENQVPILRISNSGASGFIDRGEIKAFNRIDSIPIQVETFTITY